MSRIRADKLVNRAGSGGPKFPNGVADGFSVSGIVTATSFSGPVTGDVTGNVTGNISGGTVAGSTGTFTGDVNIADKIVPTGDTNTAIRFPANDTFTVETGGAEAIRVDSSGRLLVGTIAAGSNGTADDLVVANNSSASDQAGITIRGGTSGRSQIFFSDGTSGDAEYRGMLRYDHSEESMQFRTAATERLRIDSSGTATFSGILKVVDTELQEASDNFSINIQSGNNDFYVKSGGTTFAAFKGSAKDLQLTSGNLVIGTSGKGIDFSATGDAGGMTSELLDDYEEGTWTPSLGGDASYDILAGTYTKIGNIVYVYCRIRPTSLGTGSDDTISGLPFNPNGYDNSGVMIGYYDGSAVNSVELGGVLNTNGSITLYTKTSGVNNTGSTTFFQNNCRIYLSTVYQTDS